MAVSLPKQLKQILDDKAFAHVATVGPDGHPHNSVMWVERDGDLIVVNTAEGRTKWHNLRRDPRIGISISPPADDYVNYSIKGRVVDMRTSDGDEVIDRLARKYLGVDRFPWREAGRKRVTIVVEALSVAFKG
jgi:PPOX class probable F420-dependent enzyme